MLAWRVLIPLRKAASQPDLSDSPNRPIFGVFHISAYWAPACNSSVVQAVRSAPIAMTPTAREAKNDISLSEDSMREPLDSLSIELTRISAEIQSINSGFQEKMQETVALMRDEIENDYRMRMEKRISELREQIRAELEGELRKEFDAELKARTGQSDLVQKEIERVLVQIQGVSKEIAAMLDDASIELSKVMRKRTEQAELKSYLDGLLFSVGDQPK